MQRPKKENALCKQEFVNVLENMNATMCHVFLQSKVEMPQLVELLLNYLNNANPKNTHMMITINNIIEKMKVIQFCRC
jgi:hypothetical protein